MAYIELGSEATANSPTSGTSESIPLTVALANGGYVVIWQTSDGDPLGDIRARIYDASGAPVAPAFTLFEDAAGFELPRNVAVEALPDGGFAVATFRALTTNSAGQAVTSDIALQIFSGTGAPVSGVISASPVSGVSLGGYRTEPQITISGDRLLVSWDDSGNLGTGVSARYFDFSGDALSGVIQIEDGQLEDPGGTIQFRVEAPEVAGLGDGGFVAVWTDWRNSPTEQSSVMARLFDDRGRPIGDAFVVNTATASYQMTPHVVTLEGGNFLVTWGDMSTGTLLLKGQLFGPSGTEIGGELTLGNTGNTSAQFNYHDYAVAALADGGFAVTWMNDTDDRIYVREFDASGTALRDATIVSNATGSLPSITALENGGYEISWTVSGSIISQRFTDTLAQNGSSAGETMTGTANADRLYSQGGDDTLTGASGNDILRGGSGNDTISGGTGADLIVGGAGSDTFTDTAANLNGDTIGDLSVGDRIVITDANLSGFVFSISGNTLTYSGGSLTLGSIPEGRVLASAAAGGGVQLSVIAPIVSTGYGGTDFNGDGRDDLFWRNDNGQLSNWLGQANGGFVGNDANAFTQVTNNWEVEATGDFNGDGRDDILWRHESGAMSNWLATASGGWQVNDANAYIGVSTDWHVIGTGDFNNDGRDDILWRADSGQLSNWLGTASGGFTQNDANAFVGVSTDWNVVGIGDFNGDGRDDILWRGDGGAISNWLATASGGWQVNDANAFQQIPTDWKVVGIGDFNGDGRDDILWRNDGGALSNWLGQANGGFVSNDANAFQVISTDWQVVDVGDFNGDGRDDILWRSDTGVVSNWLGQANGSFMGNDANAQIGAPIEWNVQDEGIWF